MKDKEVTVNMNLQMKIMLNKLDNLLQLGE